jgi:hypothetical protein
VLAPTPCWPGFSRHPEQDVVAGVDDARKMRAEARRRLAPYAPARPALRRHRCGW